MKKTEVLKRIEGLSDDEAKRVCCALVGHSRVITSCFGYIHCGRCGAQIGDQLGSSFDDSKCVRYTEPFDDEDKPGLHDANCAHCRSNLQDLKWSDKLLIEPLVGDLA